MTVESIKAHLKPMAKAKGKLSITTPDGKTIELGDVISYSFAKPDVFDPLANARRALIGELYHFGGPAALTGFNFSARLGVDWSACVSTALKRGADEQSLSC